MYGFREIIEAELDGFSFLSSWRKQPTQATSAGVWFDLSMSPGNPVPNYYIGPSGVFTPLRRSADGGIDHGPNVAPKTKYLRTFEIQTAAAGAVPLHLLICDYLGFYPFIDESVTEEQALTTAVEVPRVTKNTQMLPVVVAGHAGGQTFKVSYTNQDGVSGRWTPQHFMLSGQTVNGTIITSGAGPTCRAPFMALQQGDTGVQKVDSITFEGTGDIGLISMALVNVIDKTVIRGIDAPVERDFYVDSATLPIIPDDAYLALLALAAGSLSGAPIFGYIKTVYA